MISQRAALLLLLLSTAAYGDTFSKTYERAERLYVQGDYAAALVDLQAAYDMHPTPRLLFPIGQAHRKLGHKAEARSAFERYLSEDTTITPEVRARVERYLAELRVAAPAPLTEPSPPPLRAAPARPTWRLSVGGAAIGVGLTLVAVGAWALSVNDTCYDVPEPPALTCEELYSTSGLGIGALTTGLALAAGGAVLIALPPRARAAQAGVALAPLPGGLGLRWSGRF